MSFYPQILGIVDRLNELNEKINGFLGDKIDNVFVGALIFGAIIFVTFWGIRELNK